MCPIPVTCVTALDHSRSWLVYLLLSATIDLLFPQLRRGEHFLILLRWQRHFRVYVELSSGLSLRSCKARPRSLLDYKRRGINVVVEFWVALADLYFVVHEIIKHWSLFFVDGCQLNVQAINFSLYFERFFPLLNRWIIDFSLALFFSQVLKLIFKFAYLGTKIEGRLKMSLWMLLNNINNFFVVQWGWITELVLLQF